MRAAVALALVLGACEDEHFADYSAKVSVCADELDCAAYRAWLIRLTPGLHE